VVGLGWFAFLHKRIGKTMDEPPSVTLHHFGAALIARVRLSTNV
jgi:hypothetical protein